MLTAAANSVRYACLGVACECGSHVTCEQTEMRNLVNALITIGVKAKLVRLSNWLDAEALEAAIQDITEELFRNSDEVLCHGGVVLLLFWPHRKAVLMEQGSGHELSLEQWCTAVMPYIAAPRFHTRVSTTLESAAQEKREEYRQEVAAKLGNGDSRTGGNPLRRNTVTRVKVTESELTTLKAKRGRRARRASVEHLSSTVVGITKAKGQLIRKLSLQRVVEWTPYSEREAKELLSVYRQVSTTRLTITADKMRHVLMKAYPHGAVAVGVSAQQQLDFTARRLFRVFQTRRGSTELTFIVRAGVAPCTTSACADCVSLPCRSLVWAWLPC